MWPADPAILGDSECLSFLSAVRFSYHRRKQMSPQFRSTEWFIAPGLVLLAAMLTPARVGAGPASAPVATAVAGAQRYSRSSVAEYLELIQAYRREGDRDRAVTELLSWDPGIVRRVVRDVESRATPLELRVATLLHGDTGILAYRSGDEGLGAFHLERGLQLLGPASGDPNAVLWRRRWLLAIGIFHASGTVPTDAIVFLKQALGPFPNAPQLLLVLGQVEENLATRDFRGWAPRKKRKDHRRDVR